MLDIMQLLGNKALAVGKRLFSGVTNRHEIVVGLRDFDIITEHAVVADLQILDPGLFTFACLQLRDPFVAVSFGVAQFVELFVKTVGDDIGIVRAHGRIRRNGARDELAKIFQRIDLLIYAHKSGNGAVLDQRPHGRQRAKRRSETDQIARRRGRAADAGAQTLQIIDAGKCVAQVFAKRLFFIKRLDGVKARFDRLAAQKRPLDPFSKQTRAHACGCAV